MIVTEQSEQVVDEPCILEPEDVRASAGTVRKAGGPSSARSGRDGAPHGASATRVRSYRAEETPPGEAGSGATHAAIEVGHAVEPEPMRGTHRFEPLESMGTAPTPLRAGRKMASLTPPKIIRQVLADCEDHWERLCTGLDDRANHAGLRSVLVCSSLRNEGCTTVATCLALSLSRCTDKRVCLLDANFVHPHLNTLLGLKAKTGIDHVLLERTPIEQAMIAIEKPALCVVPMVHGFEYPSTSTHEDRLAEVMEAVRHHFDLVVIDGGSVFHGASPTPLTIGVDAALLVRQPSQSSEYLLDQLDKYLWDHNICGLGVIENCVEA